MSGAFNTSSADHPKQLQQKQHLFPQQQQHRTNNNKHKVAQKIVVGGCETTASKSARTGPTNRPPTPGALTVNSGKDDSGDGCRSKHFSKPSSLVNLEVNNCYPHSPFPTHSSHFVQHLADATVKGSNNCYDKRTLISAVSNNNNNNSVVNSYVQAQPNNHHSNHRPQFFSSVQNDRPSIIPSETRDQGVNSVTNLPSTSFVKPLANNCIKEEVTAEPNKRSEQLPKGGEFAVPAVPARLKAATVSNVEPIKEERRKEQLFLEEDLVKASTSVIVGIEANLLTKEEGQESCEKETQKEPKPSTSSAVEVTSATEVCSQSTSAKPFRLSFRISAASALKLHRIARNHARALRRLGICSVQLDQQQLAKSSGCKSFSLPNLHSQVRILSRTPSPEVARRESRQQQLSQQKQRLHQLAQQQLAVVAQQFRGQSSTEIYSPNKASPLHFVRPGSRLPAPPSVAPLPTPTYPYHPPVAHQSMDRQLQPGPSTLPVTPTPTSSAVAENSPLLVDLLSNSIPPNQQQQNTNSQSQNSLAAQQRFVGTAQLQQVSNQSAFTPQQRQYQQHLYQQQMHHQRVQQQQQNSFIFGPGAPAISGQMQPNQSAIMVVGHQSPHPSFMMHPQMAHHQIRPQGIPSGGASVSHGMVPTASACAMPPPYAIQPQHQQPAAMIASSKANNHGAEVEEPPKKRKRISKKQQQKEEKEREQQQLRMQQEVALVQMQQRQQQLYVHQRQMAMQQQQQQAMVPPTASQGLVGAPQQNYQQQMAQYHQQHYTTLNQQQHSNSQSSFFNSPPHGNAIGGHYTNQQSTPPQPSPQQQYPPLGAAQPAMHYMSPPGMWGASPQQQNVVDYQQQSQITVAGQNPAHPVPTVMHMPSQQQHFRTPGTPGSVSCGAMGYGHSPATTSCSTSTPFHSPQPQQQQMVGTPGGGQHTPIGGGPTPPYGNSQGSTGSVHQHHQSQRGTPVGSGGSTVEHSRTNTPQQQQPFSLHSVQQHNANNQSYQQGPPSHLSLQQMSPSDFYQQQKSIQTKQMLQQSPITQQQYHSSSAFPHLSDLAEDGLVDDLVVPSMSNEDDFDLDSIEPMRCGDHQQGYHYNQQQPPQQNTNHIGMSMEEKIAADMEMLPDRSPQIDDKPLSPSKLSETQDRNVTDAIASVMERVAKASTKNSRIKTVTHKATN